MTDKKPSLLETAMQRAYVLFDEHVGQLQEGESDALLDEVIYLTRRQRYDYTAARQAALTDARKRVWREARNPTVSKQAVLYLCEVPRLVNKKESIVPAKDMAMTSCGWQSRAEKRVALSEGIRAAAIDACIGRARQEKKQARDNVENITGTLICTHADVERRVA